MKGLYIPYGNLGITNNEFTQITDIDLLAQEVQNFIYNDPVSCLWDTNRGLDRKIIFSSNKEAIRDEVRNKIIRYFPNRVTDVYNIVVTTKSGKIEVKGNMSTIYGEVELNATSN